MSATVQLTGEITVGPPASCDSAFPGSVCTLSLSLGCGGKPAAVSATHTKQVNSSAAFVALDGIGSSSTVTQGNFLYLKSNAPMQIRMTMQNTPSDTVSILHVQGLLIVEFPSTNYLKLLEAQGVGKIEYIVTGNQ